MAGGKLSPRQRMINMMYLVLMALLALNVSKEILKSFHSMSVSFEQSRAKLETKIDGQIKAFTKSAGNDPSLAGYLDRVKQADAIVDAFIADIEKIESEISEREDDDELPQGAPEYMKDVSGSDNMEKHIFYFMKDTDNKSKPAGFRGKEFQAKINDTRKALVALLATDTSVGIEIPASKAAEIESSSALRAIDDPKNKKKTWLNNNVQHAPLGAVVALLAQIKNDARSTQSAVTDILAQGTESAVVVESLEAVVRAKSSAVMAGQEYQAEVFLAAKTKSEGNVEFKLARGGSELEVNGDRATYKIRPTSQGTVEWGGTILVKTKKGVDSIPFSGEYQVFQGNASIAATKMNVLYIGVGNPISVAVPGVEPSAVSVSIKGGGGRIGRKGPAYEAKVTQTGKATIYVTAKIDGATKSVGQQEYKVRKLPKPIAKWGTIGSGFPTPKAALLAQRKIVASMGQGFAFEGIKYNVTSFQFIYAPKRGEARLVKGNGSMITGNMKGVIQKARKGDRIIVDKIRATGPGGSTTLLPMMIEIR